jgi:serralysin
LAIVVTASGTNNPEIDGLLAGKKWSGTITYSFPDSPGDYPAGYFGNGEPATAGFASAPVAMQQGINYAIALISGYTNATIQFAGTNGADIAIAQSPAANPTSYAYYPSSVPSGGDIWFGTAYNYSQAALGNYYFTTALHELGHALGLKHSQETGGVANVAVPAAHDDLEYTLMSYRSYMGGPLTGYTNEAYGYPQTYMANDILALQTLYGANFTTHSENTVYSWSSTTGQEFINGVAQLAPGNGAGGSANRIFETIWDGNGTDTYDLSNYTTPVSINLNPGASSITSATQLAYLGSGHYAAGNIYNAYLYNNDTRSYIDNAVGGSGNDTLIGNVIANNLKGGGGNDTLIGGGGNDTILGGSGTDVAVFSGAAGNYIISYNSAAQTFTVADQRAGSPDGTDTVSGVENFQFTDGTFASSSFSAPTVIESFGSTSLVQVGNTYFFNAVAGGTGPELKYNGSPVVVGQFDPYVPVAAEQTASGYEVALKNAGTNQFSIWNTDSSANFLSYTVYSGASTALEALESSFHQDLNGDGVIGVPAAVIESFGSTALVQVGNTYFFNAVAGGTGPELKYNGSAVVVGQFDPYVPVAAEQTASGYEVALKNAGTNQFSIWNTDSNANFLSYTVYPGASTALEALESSFHQDLNGDGVIGVPTAQSAGGISLAPVSETSPVMIAGNETFVFSPDFRPSVVANGAATARELGGFWSGTADHASDAYTGQSQLPPLANESTITLADLAGHDNITSISIHIVDLHTNDFMLR